MDNDAIRLGYLNHPGWNRLGVGLGPFQVRDGLVVCAAMLNGHNGSQTSIEWDHGPKRIARGIVRGLLRWIPPPMMPDRLRRIVHPSTPHARNFPHISHNLHIGFSPSHPPRKYGGRSACFRITASGIENGTISARNERAFVDILKRATNIPRLFCVIVRQESILYCLSNGYPDNVHFTPLLIAATKRPRHFFASISQSVLGEIGFRADSRIYGMKAGVLDRWSSWDAAAQTADRLLGGLDFQSRLSTNGEHWRLIQGHFQPTPTGMRSCGGRGIATIRLTQPAGIVRVLLDKNSNGAGLVWEFESKNTYMQALLMDKHLRISSVHNNTIEELGSRKVPCGYGPYGKYDLCIYVSSSYLRAFVNGKQLLTIPRNSRMEPGHAAGIVSLGLGNTFSDFEVISQSIPVPLEIQMTLPAPRTPEGTMLHDRLYGTSGMPLDLHRTPDNRRWKHVLGKGRFELTGANAIRVRASVSSPNPGRTAYTIRWPESTPVEIATRILPPGNAKGQGEKCRAGVIFMQDPDNYLIVSTYLDDWDVGKSISTFLRLRGYEEIKHATWSNVGTRIHWGRAFLLSVCFDGMRFLARVDHEPIHYRALTDIYPQAKPLRVNRIGLVANWEFGDDTGSEFLSFAAKSSHHRISRSEVQAPTKLESVRHRHTPSIPIVPATE